MLKITKLCLASSASATAQRNIAISASRCIDQKWRADKGLPENPNAFGPLTNMPDYTFLDGRTTPLGSNQKRRLLKQQEIASKIVELTGELEFAKQRHERLKAQAAAEKQRIIQNKLKPKGHLLLKQK
ncbi:large ribosomal subunit protein mL52 [Drosophila kikkawai]|uniref:Large ribosomal subunit protein mL52 n=1 Tax=Drosophila kikkawai TaxID=30033 RepID=A0A6P4IZM4_DROKI|nr:39S ribosomal protein L52, mitochondrial [Drosophila kikkawai]